MGGGITLNVEDFIKYFNDEKKYKKEIKQLLSLQEGIKKSYAEQKNIKEMMGEEDLRLYLGIKPEITEEALSTVYVQFKPGKNMLNEQETEQFNSALETAKTKYNLDCRFEEGFTPQQAVNATRQMSSWVKEIKSLNLSPWETVVKAMEICTEFYYNLEKDDENHLLSRNPNYILNGDKICCAGYVSLMKNILKECGVPANFLSLSPVNEGEPGHAICLIYINDPKYKKEGCFICEPTWASRKKDMNGAKFMFAKYACLTIDEAKKMYKKNGLVLSDDTLRNTKQGLDNGTKDSHDHYERLLYEQEPFEEFKNVREKYGENLKSEVMATLKEMLTYIRSHPEDIPKKRAKHDNINEELLSIIQYMEITDDEEYLDAIKHDIVLDNDTLCELCASYSDKQILTAFENVFDEFVAKSDDELLKTYYLDGKSPEEFGGTLQDYESYEKLMQDKEKDLVKSNPSENVYDCLDALITIQLKEGKTRQEAAVHALAVINGYDAEREKFCLEFINQFQDFFDINTLIKVNDAVKAKEQEGEFEHLYPGHRPKNKQKEEDKQEDKQVTKEDKEEDINDTEEDKEI